jgi:hypothetical protein
MSLDFLGNQGNVRGTDSNSLLRIYDQAQALLAQSPLQQERLRAQKAVQRIARELKRRNVPLEPDTVYRSGI